MRTRLPALRTLPSSTVATPSARPISSTVAGLSLNANADVRAETRKPLILASTFSISSASPSEKYSSSALALRLTNGRTAIEATIVEVGLGAIGAPRSSERRSARSSFSTSRAVWKRSRGSFSRQRLTMCASAGGMSSRTLVSDGGLSRRIAEVTSALLSPVNGRVPIVNS
jgi:hypothetical protein